MYWRRTNIQGAAHSGPRYADIHAAAHKYEKHADFAPTPARAMCPQYERRQRGSAMPVVSDVPASAGDGPDKQPISLAEGRLPVVRAPRLNGVAGAG